MGNDYSIERDPADPDESVEAPLTIKNPEFSDFFASPCWFRARQKEFNKYFKQAGINEKLLDYYSCALVGDILLQGYMYITKNYFAFYSNVFGYITKLLIPMTDVVEVSKEKTARIIPNAVGIATVDEKHIFGSLLCRDATYKFMLEVWKASKDENPVIKITPPKSDKNNVEESASDDLLEDDSTVSGSEIEEASLPEKPLSSVKTTKSHQSLVQKRKTVMEIPRNFQTSKVCWNSMKMTTILAILTAVLISLYLSAGLMLYRIAEIQNHLHDCPTCSRGGSYYDILKLQAELHSKTESEIMEIINANLNHILKVRLNLDALSVIILTERDKVNDSLKKLMQQEKELSETVMGETGEDVS